MTNKEIVKKYVTLYYADWCAHCKTFKPEWFKLKSAYNKVKYDIKNKYKIELILNEYDNDISPQKITDAGVVGFPTIKIKYNDKTDDYIGDRTAKGLFKKLIPESNDDEIISWLDKAVRDEKLVEEVSLDNDGVKRSEEVNPLLLQFGGTKGIRNYGIKGTDLRILFANSYRKYLKYKKKCESLNLI